MHAYASGIIKKIESCIETQECKLKSSAEYLAESVKKGGLLHVFGSGHSHMIAEEIFYRAGGPLFVNPILDSGLMLHNGAQKSTKLERLPGYAEAILDSITFGPHDVFLIISNSGRNIVPIEVANYANNKELLTVSISSFVHSQAVNSRHNSGKKLYDLTDISLDNYGEIGDAQLKKEGLKEKYGATSSVMGIILVQTWISMTIEILVENNITPPLIRSANLDESEQFNNELMQKYANRISLLK